MHEHIRNGEIERTFPVDPPPETRRIIDAILAQNDRVLEANARLLDALCMTSIAVPPAKAGLAEMVPMKIYGPGPYEMRCGDCVVLYHGHGLGAAVKWTGAVIVNGEAVFGCWFGGGAFRSFDPSITAPAAPKEFDIVGVWANRDVPDELAVHLR